MLLRIYALILAIFAICSVIILLYSITNDKQTAKENLIKKLNSENCKLILVIQPTSFFEKVKYQYQCDNKGYSLNIDISDKLKNKGI